MAKSSEAKKRDGEKRPLSPEQRSRRNQQILFTILSVILIISWIAALLAK
jgi:hypothetical protein